MSYIPQYFSILIVIINNLLNADNRSLLFTRLNKSEHFHDNGYVWCCSVAAANTTRLRFRNCPNFTYNNNNKYINNKKKKKN